MKTVHFATANAYRNRYPVLKFGNQFNRMYNSCLYNPLTLTKFSGETRSGRKFCQSTLSGARLESNCDRPGVWIVQAAQQFITLYSSYQLLAPLGELVLDFPLSHN